MLKFSWINIELMVQILPTKTIFQRKTLFYSLLYQVFEKLFGFRFRKPITCSSMYLFSGYSVANVKEITFQRRASVVTHTHFKTQTGLMLTACGLNAHITFAAWIKVILRGQWQCMDTTFANGKCVKKAITIRMSRTIIILRSIHLQVLQKCVV